MHERLFPPLPGMRVEEVDQAVERLRDLSRWGVWCDECGRPLTEPRSIARGFGPTCWARLYGPVPVPPPPLLSRHDDRRPIYPGTDF